MSKDLTRYDAWLTGEDPAAVVLRENLQPVGGDDAVVFPPTFAPGEGQPKGSSGYIVDDTGTCIIDTVGSQANRMEPLFKTEAFSALVPQVKVNANGAAANLLDLGHRGADALIRFSTVGEELHSAFAAYTSGDAEPLAKIAPTSLVFGAWDSRGTQAKIPRIVESVVRAYNVVKLERGAQYVPAVRPEPLGIADEFDQKSLSEMGFSDAPSRGPGGVVARGGIRRDAVLNLTALRAIHAKTAEKTLALRRYILGLALVAFESVTHETGRFLRQGCLLVRHPEKGAEWWTVNGDGTRSSLQLQRDGVIAYATEAANAFGVGVDREAQFEVDRVRAEVEGKAAKPKAKKAAGKN